MAMNDFPIDHRIWHFIVYCAGIGGSLFVIGSATGVAAMGMEKINFMWYLKNIAPLALLGFLGGALSFNCSSQLLLRIILSVGLEKIKGCLSLQLKYNSHVT